MDLLYHASQTRGLKVFEPRPYWHVNFALSGPVGDGTDVPPSATFVEWVYAVTRERVSFYFFPPGCPRLWVSRQKNRGNYDLLFTALGDVGADNVVFVAPEDRPALDSYEFSLYAFDAREFQRLPNGEFVSGKSVTPVGEQRYDSPLSALTEAGYQVQVSPDLVTTRDQLCAVGLIVDSQGVQCL